VLGWPEILSQFCPASDRTVGRSVLHSIYYPLTLHKAAAEEVL